MMKMTNNERMIEHEGVKLCSESFGSATDPAIILIMGAAASMIWWDSEFCERLASRGFHVIRFDNRDTGRSSCYPPGEPAYSVADMAEDIITVMDAYGISEAHLAGMSLGGMLAQIAALLYPERIRTITMIASGLWADMPDLPPIEQKILDYHASGASVDWSDKEETVRYMTGGWELLNGSRHPFDADRARRLAEAESARADSLLSMFNHALLRGGEELYGRSAKISAPTLIIHGTEDPVLPFAHAEAIHKAIPGSRLVVLEGAGHEIHREDWDTVIDAIAGHVSGGA